MNEAARQIARRLRVRVEDARRILAHIPDADRLAREALVTEAREVRAELERRMERARPAGE